MEDEIIINEEFEETTEEIEPTKSKPGFLTIAAVSVGVAAVGYLAYKKVVKPLVAKHKAKKESKAMLVELDENDEEE